MARPPPLAWGPQTRRTAFKSFGSPMRRPRSCPWPKPEPSSLSEPYGMGPPILLHLLHVQWKETAATSWLQQFAVDIQAVAVYVPAVRLLTDQPCPVEALCEVLQQEPRWWKAQIRAAIQAYHKELEVWYSQPPPAGADLAPSNMPRPFVCPHCQASFELRKTPWGPFSPQPRVPFASPTLCHGPLLRRLYALVPYHGQSAQSSASL